MFASAANARAGVEGPILPDGNGAGSCGVACLAPSRGFKLYNRKVGDQRSRIRLLKNTVHVFGAALVVVMFRQRAGVEKIVWQISVLAGERLQPRKENQRLWTVRISLHPG